LSAAAVNDHELTHEFAYKARRTK